MALCASSHNNGSIIEINSDEEITVEMEDLDWQKQVLEEKLQRKAKAKWERREKEAAERWEEEWKQREEEDWKRKEKKNEDWRRREEADWKKRWEDTEHWRRREEADWKKRWEDTEHWKNESTQSIWEQLRWEEAKMWRSSPDKGDRVRNTAGSLGPHQGPESGGSDGWSTWNGRIQSLLTTNRKKCTKPRNPMFAMEMEGKTSLPVQYRIQQENAEAGPGPAMKRQRSEQVVGEAGASSGRFANSDIGTSAEKGKGKECVLDINQVEEGSGELKYNMEGMASLNDSLKTLHWIAEINYKFWKKQWKTYNGTFAQPEVELEPKAKDVAGEKPAERGMEEVSEEVLEKGKGKEKETDGMDMDVVLEVTGNGILEKVENTKELEKETIEKMENLESADLGKEVREGKEKVKGSVLEAKAPEDETME
ncbi:hypothetical protein K439DRAFT_1611675 [Ramaria rubella]|nr:hypothetical protein K439DRAFT_1611675 [Ramaria rubella]